MLRTERKIVGPRIPPSGAPPPAGTVGVGVGAPGAEVGVGVGVGTPGGVVGVGVGVGAPPEAQLGSKLVSVLLSWKV